MHVKLKITQYSTMKKDTEKSEHFHAYLPGNLTQKLRQEAEINERKISGQLKLILEERYSEQK